MGGGQQTQTGDQKFTGDDQDHDPGGHELEFHERHEGGADEYFVGQWIHQAAEITFAIDPPCQFTIEDVSQAGDEEHDQGGGLGVGQGHRQQADQNRGQHQPTKREHIG